MHLHDHKVCKNCIDLGVKVKNLWVFKNETPIDEELEHDLEDVTQIGILSLEVIE